MSTTNVIQLPPNKKKAVKRLKPKEPFILKLARFGFSTLGVLFPKRAARLAYKLFSTPQIRAKHKKSDVILEKAKVFDFMYAGRILKGYEWGSGEQIVLLVHGWESRGTALRSFVPGLVKKGFKVVAFDGPAHGNSYGKRTNLLHFGGAIRAIINQVGPVHSLIAHSFGGASTVFALSTLDTSIHLNKLVLIAVPARLEKIIEGFKKYIQLPQKAYNELVLILEGIVNRRLSEVDVSQANDLIDVDKTLLIHDREDNVVPFSSSEIIADNWTNTSFLITEGYGHYNLVKNDMVIHQVVEFISEE